MATQELVKNLATTLKLGYMSEHLAEWIKEAEKQELSYQEFMYRGLEKELELRKEKASAKRLKSATFPVIRTFEEFDFDFQKSLCPKKMNRLKELDWIEQLYNLIFLGPPGVGKTHLAIALGYEAVLSGYKVSFNTADLLMHTLKTKEITRKSKSRYNKIIGADLVIIDELGYLPITREEANLFFQLISQLHEQTSIIITSNKGFEQWAELLGDAALTTAILDRITFKCELFTMNGKSYRLENRQSYFELENVQ